MKTSYSTRLRAFVYLGRPHFLVGGFVFYGLGVAMARYSYLTMNTGSRVGANFLLDPEGENRIGRGLECSIVVTDALCSRVHVCLRQDDGAWHLEDAESRNGTGC